MLFALIPLAWLAVMTLLWAVCKTARHGDESLPSAHRGGRPGGDGLAIWKDLPELKLQDTRRRTARGASQSPASDDVPLTAPGVW